MFVPQISGPVASALADTKQPLVPADIATVVEKKLAAKLADHHLRVPIRLFLHVDPPLITRRRARYSAVDAKNLGKAAAELWQHYGDAALSVQRHRSGAAGPGASWADLIV